jgi:hypothetical protein
VVSGEDASPNLHVTDSRRPLALIIGIADYVVPRLRLATPVHDAEALAAMLEQRHGYEVKLVRDREASRAALVDLLETQLPSWLDASRPLLVYFAGHGMATDSLDEPRGYLVPADGDNEVGSLLAMADVAQALAKLPCRHLLLLLDCCFAGAFRWSAGRDVVADAPPTLYRERYERFLETPAWQVITSAAHDELAADSVEGLAIGKRELEGDIHSPFLQALLCGLGGEADVFPRHPDGTAGDGVITATELYLFLRHQVEAEAPPERRQTPGLWVLPRHRKGEYIFYVPATKPALPDAPSLSLKTSPYRGFFVYKERHAALFHGRRAATEALHRHVERQPIAIVVGSSGTGKSSLVRAGLIPALRAAHPDWQILPVMRPGAAPRASLESAIARRDATATAVLLVDQLEDMFAPTICREERTSFFVRLLALAASGSVRVVGTLRADREPELLGSPLGEIWDQARFPLADMTQDELRQAIERPAELQGLTFEPPAMVDRLINSVMAMPGALPLLSFTLHKLYVDCLQRAANDRKLLEPTETGATSLVRALCEHTDQLYTRFDPLTRGTMRRVLLRMVHVSGDVIARRRVPRAELDSTDAAEDQRVLAVLDALTGWSSNIDFERTPVTAAAMFSHGLRLAVRGGSNLRGRHGERGSSFVELAHDAVVRDWPQFRTWLNSAGDDLELHRAVTASATQWDADRRHAGYLWRDDPRLPDAERLLASPHKLNRIETAFILRSRAARRRRNRRALHVVIAVLVTAPLLVRVGHTVPMNSLGQWRRTMLGKFMTARDDALAKDVPLACPPPSADRPRELEPDPSADRPRAPDPGAPAERGTPRR